MKKKLLLSILVLVLIFSIPSVNYASDEVFVLTDGHLLEENDLSEIVEDRVYVPLRAISERFDFEVLYDNDTKKIEIKKDDRKLDLKIGEKKALINGKISELETAPYIKSDRTMVPLRFIAEALDKNVYWNDRNKVAVIESKFSEKSQGKEVKLKNVNGKLFLSEDFLKDVEISEKALTEGDVTFIAKDFKDEDGFFGVIAVLDESVRPTLDQDHGYVLSYNPETERFINVSYPLESSFPENKRKEIAELQKKCFEEIKTFTFDEVKAPENMSILKFSGENKKMIEKSEELIEFAPKPYFLNNVAYVGEVDEGTLFYYRNLNSDGSVSSKVEILFDGERNPIRYIAKFYDDTEISEGDFSEEDIQNEVKLFQNSFIGKNIGIKKTPDVYPSLYEKGVHEQYTDDDGNIYVINAKKLFIEYASVKR